MNCGRHGCNWMTCTLCRSGHQSAVTLQKASRRSVDWPSQVQKPPIDQVSRINYKLFCFDVHSHFVY